MTSEMINNTNKELGLDDLFKNAVTLQSIGNVHCVTVNGNDINTWTITRATNTSPMPTRARRRRRDIRQNYKELKKCAFGGVGVGVVKYCWERGGGG